MNDQSKRAFNDVSAQIRWVKREKNKAYRENRLEDAKAFESSLRYFRQLSNMIQNKF